MSHPDDIYEKEANQIAEHVTYSSASLQSKVPIRPSAIEKINHKSPYGEDVSNIKTSSSEAYAFSEDRLQGIDNIGDRGFPLNISTRSHMESRFGFDFSRIRIHSDEKAAESAQAMNALAYTIGKDIFWI